MTDEKIKRINELAHKKKAEGLTEAETLEQMALREEYIAEFRKNLRGQLENIVIDYPDGRSVNVKDLRNKKDSK